MTVALALALCLVSLVLVAGCGLLGWTVFTAIRRDLAAMLAQLTKAQDAGTRLLEELVQAERELRPAVEMVQREVPKTLSATTLTDNGAQARAPREPGVAPLPGWLQEKIDEAQLLRIPTDAAVPAQVPWDVSDQYDGGGLEQAVTPAPGSKLRAEAPPPPVVG